MYHSFKVGDKVTNSCFPEFNGRVFTVIAVDDEVIVTLEGDVSPYEFKYKKFHYSRLTLIESAKVANFSNIVIGNHVCKHCGLPVVERMHSLKMVWYHTVDSIVFRTCKYALERAGKPEWTTCSPELLAEQGEFLNLSKVEPEPEKLFCKHCGYPVKESLNDNSRWLHYDVTGKHSGIWDRCGYVFTDYAEPGGTDRFAVNNLLTVASIPSIPSSRRKFRDE